LRAARANGALFYPIKPGHEEESWRQFHDEAIHKFLALDYAGSYEAGLIADFEQLLPAVPAWKQ
ncbi:MAG: HAD family hydrolase, partial [Thermoanaerobaculia bacterium]